MEAILLQGLKDRAWGTILERAEKLRETDLYVTCGYKCEPEAQEVFIAFELNYMLDGRSSSFCGESLLTPQTSAADHRPLKEKY